MRKRTIVIVSSLIIALFACQDDDDGDSSVDVIYDPTPYLLNTQDFPSPEISDDNQLTVQGVRLGRMLFYEQKLSKDGSMSCANCHNQKNAFTDTNRLSIGVNGLPGKRQAMAVFNMAWNNNEFFWDGRAHLLRHQSLLPIQDPLEMNETLENVIVKLNSEEEYRDQFIRAFGDNQITELRISLALEQFMNSIVSVDSKYDRYLRGTDTLTTSEERGRYLFFTEFNPGLPSMSGAECQHCHSTINFENDKYLIYVLDSDADITDIGREDVTKNPSDRGKFKVTSLRNVEVTMPYMHDGRFKTLEDVVEHYNSGLKNSSTLDPTLLFPFNSGGLMLSNADKIHLVNFLKTLTDNSLLTNPEYSNPF
jgi:cytochrome c peroxidase